LRCACSESTLFESDETQTASAIAAATAATAVTAAGTAQRGRRGTTFGRSLRAASRIRSRSAGGGAGETCAYASAEAALVRLEELRPTAPELVVCHGDYCLPNVLIDGWPPGRVTGFVDLGKLGVADRWWDLAVATWSVTWNLRPGWEDLFLEAYGVARDDRKQAFFRLLYDLAP
jgi:kanamycin kinase